MRPAKILIRLRERAGWSETSPGGHVQMYFSDVTVQITVPIIPQIVPNSIKVYEKHIGLRFNRH